MTWEQLQKDFMALTIKAGGPSKSNSGTIKVHYGEDGVTVEFGTYDINNYSRHHQIGPFINESIALQSAQIELETMKKAIEMELEEDIVYEDN